MRLRTSSHLLKEALCTAFQSQCGISVSALEHACAVLMNETPKRARTEFVAEWFGKEKDSSAPAWNGEGEGMPGKDKLVTFEEMVKLFGLDAEVDWYVPDCASVCERPPGGAKS